jgi:putative endonuclease
MVGGGLGYASTHLPVELVYAQEFQTVREAMPRERQVKGWSRKKKEALIAGDFGLLVELSKSNTQKPSP